MDEYLEFEAILKRWRTWLRFRRSLTWGVQGLIFGLAVSLGFSTVMVWSQALLASEFLQIILLASLGSMLGLGLGAFLWPVSELALARFYDRYYALQERASTALEIRAGKITQQEGEIASRQLTDTLLASRRVSPDWHFFLPVKRGQWLGILGLVAAVLVVLYLGQPAFKNVLQQRAVQSSVQQEKAAIENLVDQIQSNPNLTDPQRQELVQPLQDALEGLQEAQSMEQAVSVLTRARDQIQPLTDAQAERNGEGLQNAGTLLSQSQGSPLQPFGQELADGNFQNAAQELRNLAGELADMTPQELEALASQLEQAAGALESSSPDVSEALRQAAVALQQGDLQAARQSLEQAAQSLSQTGAQIAQAQSAAQAAAQLGQGQQQVIQAGQSPQAGQTQGQGQGASPGQASGSEQGSGQSQSQGQNQNSSGSGRGEGGGDSGTGPEAGDSPIDQNNGPGDAGETSYEQIYAPQRLGGSAGEAVNLPGSGTSGDQTINQGNAAPGDPGDSRVPYVEVFPSYAETYRQAIDNGEVPLSLRELVKKYFSSLEP